MIIVIGSGIAGLSAAVGAVKAGCEQVILISKTTQENCNTYHAQGGIAAAVFDDDNPVLHADDTCAAGAGLCDRKAVEILTSEGAVRVKELIGQKVRFDYDESGSLRRGLEAAHSRPRIIHASGDATGKIIEQDMFSFVRNDSRITVKENLFLRDLIVRDGSVSAVVLIDINTGEKLTIEADSVILATGGAGQMFSYTTNPETATADGLAAALRAGAEVEDLEFFQFHPTALAVGENFLISEAVRGEGAVLRDENGKRYMPDIDSRAELAPRDVVARANFRVMQSQDMRPVYLDVAGLESEAKKRDMTLKEFLAWRFPSVDAAVRAQGFDWSKKPIPVTPAAHYWMGGIRTDTSGRTSLPGLYAAGECARTGVQGANRLASNSLLEGLVFGYRAGCAAVKDCDTRNADSGAGPFRIGFDDVSGSVPESVSRETFEIIFPAGEAVSEAASTENVDTQVSQTAQSLQAAQVLRGKIRSAMWANFGLVRNADGLKNCIKTLETLYLQAKTAVERLESAQSASLNRAAVQEKAVQEKAVQEKIAAYENLNLATAGLAAATAALRREESRGAHTRSDFPETNDALAYSVAYRMSGEPAGEPAVKPAGEAVVESARSADMSAKTAK
ncbi:MAG: FAD-binding protein [Bifidobacteriaceae bacterium]|nr:FAD-binding protein [Bifidobacteriaceae bacterium]